MNAKIPLCKPALFKEPASSILDLKCHIPAGLGLRAAGAEGLQHTGPVARAADPWDAHVHGRSMWPAARGGGRWLREVGPCRDHMI